MDGLIHSLESFGTVDGPGIRMVVFFQGCLMRCAYCHNPDTWTEGVGTRIRADEIVARFVRNRGFYKNGGITASGGEPLLQLAFLTELFQKAKKEKISTCLDTTGIVFPYRKTEQGFVRAEEGISESIRERGRCTPLREYEELLAVTDLVLLDIKHTDPEEHRKLTGHRNAAVFSFLDFLEENKVPVWIRRVAVPGLTDHEEELISLGRYLGTKKNIEALEVLPYHTMGKVKYEGLGIKYRLPDVPEMSKEEAGRIREVILRGMRQTHNH